jgi:mutator protein MutT
MLEIKQRIAVKALIINNQNQVLLVRKGQDGGNGRQAGNSGRYNLPGGKIEPGETIQEGLEREVQEETGLIVGGQQTSVPLFVGEWRPVVNGVLYQIIGMFFVCKTWSGDIKLNDEHDEFVWISHESLSAYDILPPEDIAIKIYFEA